MKNPTSRPLNALELQQLSIALAVSCLPHLLEQPWWLAASLSMILLTLSQLSADTRLRLPRYSHWLLGILVGGLVFQAYSTLVGREGGVAVLMALSIVKLIETRSLRDARALFLLMFLLTGVAYLHSQTPWQAAYSLFSTGVILFSAQRIEHNILPHRINLKNSSRIILEGIPIAALLFVLFPRLPAPLWALPDPNSAQSGLSSEQMSPGSIGNMIQDESIAFRVQFNGATPRKSDMYWRGPIFEDFDGERWLPAWKSNPSDKSILPKEQFTQAPKLTGLGPSYNYTITLEPHQQHWVLALDLPTKLPPQLAFSNRMQVITPQAITERRRFELSAQTRWITRENTIEQLDRSLRIPTDLNPKTQALAQQWRHLAPEQRVNKALQWLKQGEFSYTLSPPLLTSRNRIDEFLFKNKKGFCEHYASAFTVLMRAAGVPSRVVTGYQGASQNGNYWLVRQADAHAWVEVWLGDQGWQRVDPTFVISPNRINAGIARSISNEQLPFMLREDHAWLRNLRLKADVLINGWNQWVVGYDQQRQNDLLKRLGITDFLSTAFLLWLMGGMTITLGGFAAWLLYKNRPPKADQASRLYRRFCHQLRAIQIDPSEPPKAFSTRAQLAYPELALEIGEITDLYLQARYGNDSEALEQLKSRVAALGNRMRKMKLSR